MASDALTSWLPIVYRDFWDFPRSFAFQLNGLTILCLSDFEDAIDDFSSHYTIYATTCLPSELPGDWCKLPDEDCRYLGRVRATAVRFDKTRRKEVDVASVFPQGEVP